MGRSLVFALNGERVELAAVDPRTTVLQYIRSQGPSLQGTKLGCGEGGCGACTVLLSRYDPTLEHVEEFTINSCLAPLCSIDGCAVTTTEGLTTSRTELHAVHKRLAGFHGSQCGFCTPGMSMSIYGGLRQSFAKAGAATAHAHCKDAHLAHNGIIQPAGVKLSCHNAEIFISGNICRCTGYRPILDACKSFSGDIDVEDLGMNAFWASKHQADAGLLPPYDPEKDPKFPSFLVEELQSRNKDSNPPPSLSFKHVEGKAATMERLWVSAASLSEVFNLLQEYSTKKVEVKLVVGNTSAGVYKHMNPQVYIDISQVPELRAVKATEHILEVGAVVSLAKLIGLLEAESHSRESVYAELAKHVRQIASEQVRNRASLGGNLILAQKLGFDSDLATILLGAGAEVTLASTKGQSIVPIEQFLYQRCLEPGIILVSVRIPSWNDLSNCSGVVGAKLFFKTYRVSCRPNGNAVSYINAALLSVVDKTDLGIRDLKLAFGAFGGPHAIRAVKTEKLLVGKSVSPAGLQEAIKMLREEIKPPPTVHKAAYRTSVAVGFFFDFFNTSLLSPNTYVADDEEDFFSIEDGHKAEENGDHSDPLTADNGASKTVTPPLSNRSVPPAADNEPKVIHFGTETKPGKMVRSKRPVSSSSQKFATFKEFWPVNQPSKKSGVELQVSGEAVYVDDLPAVKGTLYATFVLSGKQPGKIVSIDTTEALKTPGAVDFVSAKDIPGTNIGFNFFFYQDWVFAEDRVESANDPVGVLVADSYEHAREAAAKVQINVEEQEGRIYTIEEAIKEESYGDLGVLPFVGSSSFGEYPVNGLHRIENAEVYSGSQYHFYMETQAAYAVPDEDGCITVYSANQSPTTVQNAIAASLGIPMNNVRVITRRLGGAFGGKVTKASSVAVACALAAYKLKRPVKISLDRQTDMRMCAGRHELKAVYTVDFNDDGKITGLHTNAYLDGGRAKDISPLVLLGLSAALRQYDWGSLRSEHKICKTNKVSRTIMRGPGDVQGHFIAETVIEHVAAYLGIDACRVRERNMHSMESLNKFFPTTTNSVDSYTLPHIWEKLKDSSQFEKRQLAVKNFNARSKWVKKGIDIVVGIYDTSVISKPARVSIFEDGSIVVEVGGIEMGQGLWTKVRQSVAYGLSKLWGPDAHPEERLEMSSIRVVQNDSISLPNSDITGGSTGSESSCQAALMACEILVESFKPFLQKLREAGVTPAPWAAIIGMAKVGGASLSAQGNHVADMMKCYLNFGACVSEVSIDVLTGSTTIHQTDLLYDCGRSLNPAVDIGQVEGAFVMGLGFYLTEEWREVNGHVISNGTWDYKPPTMDNIPKRFHVELSNAKVNRERILSSKASGEPPILLAKSVHSAVRHAITAAREDLRNLSPCEVRENETNAYFRLDSPASIDKVRTLCGLDNVERYLASLQ